MTCKMNYLDLREVLGLVDLPAGLEDLAFLSDLDDLEFFADLRLDS